LWCAKHPYVSLAVDVFGLSWVPVFRIRDIQGCRLRLFSPPPVKSSLGAATEGRGYLTSRWNLALSNENHPSGIGFVEKEELERVWEARVEICVRCLGREP